MHSLETEAGLNTSVFVNLRLFLFDFHTCQLSFSISVCTHTHVGLCTPTPTDTPHTRPAHPRLGAGQREDRAAVWVLLRCTWARLRAVCAPSLHSQKPGLWGSGNCLVWSRLRTLPPWAFRVTAGFIEHRCCAYCGLSWPCRQDSSTLEPQGHIFME